MPDVLTSGEAAELLGVATETVRKWSNERMLPVAFRTAGGHRRFRTCDVRMLQRQRDGICGICAGDVGVICSSCDGACVTAAGLACPDCGGVGEVAPAHCCVCGLIDDDIDAPCACPPDE